MAVVTPDIVAQVARLARLRLEGPALAQFAAQLDEILQYVQRLQAVDTAKVEPTSHVLPLSNVLRKDEPRASLPVDAVTAMAPAKRPPYFAVPKVIES
jgi:aspartyl-tRNA(Asn)/glutamyl-tRNA(Gln) amidotransferase subunit C